ncbi:MAG: arsenite methyltransferase [Gemmataceae bacterium]|nr:arsenite methyltransferase [Gemmataceae bacterium]
MSETSLTDIVRQKYAAVASSGITQETAGVKEAAQAFGYSAEELAQLPAEANMALGCGNPTALANLKAGEVVVDLGCGGGIDVLLAARKVGPTGKAIGIDMTPEMIERARRNAARVGLENVAFYQATLDALPLPDASADCLISNCVINLVPDKAAAFREMYRVLKPGGRIAISDIALKRPLPPELARSVAALVGCIAGALTFEEYIRLLQDAGFVQVQVLDSGADLNAYALVEGQSGCCSPAMSVENPPAQAHTSTRENTSPRSALPISEEDWIAASQSCCGGSWAQPEEESPTDDNTRSFHEELAVLLRRYDINDYAASVKVSAVKPG